MLKISLSGATVSEVAGQKILSQRVTAGFKIVFDNIDLTVRPHHTTEEWQSLSLHNVNAYAVKDCVDDSTFSDTRDQKEDNLYAILPSEEDNQSLKERFIVYVSRIMVKYIKFFHDDFQTLVQQHIPHQFSKEMSKKSEVLSETCPNFK